MADGGIRISINSNREYPAISSNYSFLSNLTIYKSMYLEHYNTYLGVSVIRYFQVPIKFLIRPLQLTILVIDI